MTAIQGKMGTRPRVGGAVDKVIGGRVTSAFGNKWHYCGVVRRRQIRNDNRGWLHGCMVAWLHGCMVAWLHGCMVAWLHGCMVNELVRELGLKPAACVGYGEGEATS